MSFLMYGLHIRLVSTLVVCLPGEDEGKTETEAERVSDW